MNSKNKKIIGILVMAFIVAVIGGVALYFYLVPQKTTVYVFKTGAKAGDVVTSDMLTAVQADSKIIVAGANTDTYTQFVTGESIDAVLKSGDSLRMDVSAGMPLTLSMMTANGGSTIEMNMDPTKIPITVPISDITGVTNELKNGSRVNIFVTGANESGIIQTSMPLVDMRILAVNKDANGSLTSATVECTTEQAIELVYYASNCTIYFGLVDSTGYQYPSVDNPSFSIGAKDNYVDENIVEGNITESVDQTDNVNTTEAVTEEQTDQNGVKEN